MVAVSLALIACFAWGIADFLGGLKSRVLPVITVLMLSGIIGLGFVMAVVGIRGTTPPSNPVLLLAVAAGASGVVAMLLLYKGLAVGSMTVVAPISATGVMLPVLMGLATGDAPSKLQSLGMVAAITGAVLSSRKKEKGKSKRIDSGAGLAMGAAVAIGLFFIVMDRASDVDPLWAALLMRSSYCIFLLPVILVVRPSLKVGLSHLPGIVTLGIFDALAGVMWAMATTMGMLSLVSVLGSLYPAVTVVLASVILREKTEGGQFIGVILAISGVALISAG